jgi:tetratricopeptide (TPR) repeat protein
MKPVARIALLSACFLTAGSWLCAQDQQGGSAASSSSSQKKQNGSAPQSPADANPFPGDETNVPVLPSKDTPDIPADSNASSEHAALPAGDADPVASPDDGAAAGDSQPASGFSSSSSGVGGLLDGPDDEPQSKHGKQGQPAEPEHHETAAEDENVGKYYLDNKDWHAALSRYQSAMVLDPENPDVYWGLAESERHLGNYAEARANYQKVMDYDPGSKHAKEAAKALKEPELANAKAAPPAQPGAKNQ